MDFMIVGSGRSGTTLLRAMLNNLGSVHIPHESDFLARAYPFFKSGINESDYRVALSFFFKTSQNHGWGIDFEELLIFLKKEKPYTLDKFYDLIVSYYLIKNDLKPSLVGNKTPVLIHDVKIIRKLYPKLKVIHIVRDGRDVFLSYSKIHKTETKVFGPKRLLTNAMYWRVGVHNLSTDNDWLKVIRYEDLLEYPELTVSSVCEFLNVNYSDTALEFYKKKDGKDVLEEHREGIHKKMSQKVDSSNKNKFLKLLSSQEIKSYECMAGPELKKFGYEFFSEKRPFFYTAFYNILFDFSQLFNFLRLRFRDFERYNAAKKDMKS